jgi:hypothetical protein
MKKYINIIKDSKNFIQTQETIEIEKPNRNKIKLKNLIKYSKILQRIEVPQIIIIKICKKINLPE